MWIFYFWHVRSSLASIQYSIYTASGVSKGPFVYILLGYVEEATSILYLNWGSKIKMSLWFALEQMKLLDISKWLSNVQNLLIKPKFGRIRNLSQIEKKGISLENSELFLFMFLVFSIFRCISVHELWQNLNSQGIPIFFSNSRKNLFNTSL